jgi:molecular chaperone DnaK (HSP70)
LVSAKAILGVDLGSLYMKVALVQRGAPLEIVTNMHSKRKTEQMILFDQNARFYGADASSLLARKPTQTPVGFSIMLGRDEDHPAVKVRSHCHDLKTKNKDVFMMSFFVAPCHLSSLICIAHIFFIFFGIGSDRTSLSVKAQVQ